MPSLLDSLLRDPSSRIVLDADEWRKRSGDQSVGIDGPAYFHATSGCYQSKFVSIHNLFKIPEACAAVLDELADAALKLKIQFGFNAILACTVTPKMLMERLHARLESTPDELATIYLGNFPFLNPENQGLIDLSGQRVLILADVIATGTTVAKICETVKQCHGEALAILAVVLTEPSMMAPGIAGQGRLNDITLRYLSLYPIKRSTLNELPEIHGAIDIDPLTMMPVIEPTTTSGHSPVVSTINSIRHFEQSQSLRTGFFQRDGRRMTVAIRFDKLFAYRHANEANPTWHSISHLIDDFHQGTPWILATTFNENDIAFAEFLQQNLSKSSKPVNTLYIPRADTLQIRNYYFLPDKDARLVKNARLLLVLSSCNTGEKVTKLASLLASHSAKRIQVICLVNRLGVETTDFIRRIELLIDGSPDNHIRFSFLSVYDLLDFSQHELSQLVSTIDNLASHYCQRTRVLGFRRWMEHEQKYFKFRGMTGKRFLGEPPEYDLDALERATEEFQLDMALFCLQRKLFDERNGHIQPLLDLICAPHTANQPFGPRSVVEKGTLYKLYALFISQIHLLKQTRQFSAVRKCLIELIRTLRDHRFALERSTAGKGNSSELVAEIRECIDREVQLWFGLALLSLNDNDDHEGQPTYGDLMVEALTCGRSSPAEWTATPRNMVYYFSDDMVMWACSLLAVFSERHDEQFAEEVERYRETFWKFFPEEEANDWPTLASTGGLGKQNARSRESSPKAGVNNLNDNAPLELKFLKLDQASMTPMQARFRIRNNFDFLLAELKKHSEKQNHEIIRFLHSRLIYTGKDHNPITSAVRQALDTIMEDVDDRKPTIGEFFKEKKAEVPQPQQYEAVSLPEGVKRRKLQSALEEAIYATSALEEIAVALPSFFRFTSAKRDEIARYVDSDSNSISPSNKETRTTFLEDVRLMAEAFDRMRRDNRVSLADYRSVDSAWTRVEYDMYSEQSVLRQALLAYIVVLDAPVDAAEGKASATDSSSQERPTRKTLLSHARELALTTLARKAAVAQDSSVSKRERKKEEHLRDGLERFWESFKHSEATQFVLADYWFATELLKNLLTNVRHAYKKVPASKLPKKLLTVEVGPGSSESMIAIVVTYFGEPFPEKELPRTSTLLRHRSELEQFGGRLEWGNSSDNSGSWVRVEFMTRRDPIRKHAVRRSVREDE